VRRPLRLAYVTGSLMRAGSERQMLSLARRSTIPVRLLPATERAGTLPHVFAWRTLTKATAVVRLLRQGRYDLVDAWLYPSYAQVALTRPLTGVPIVIAGRRSLSDYKAAFGWFDRTLDRLARDRADAIVANSAAVIDDVVAREGVARDRLRLIRNGVELPAPLPAAERAALRAAWGVAPDELLVGTVANLKPAKGVARIVDAAAAVAAALPEARYRVIGEGYQRPELEARIASHGLTDRFVLLGSLPDARAVLGAFDLVVHASEAEGLPNAVLEAAAAGRPILATAAGGTGEIVTDGETGLLVPVGDGDALAAGLVRLARDPDLRARLGAAARERAAREFGMDRFVAQTVALYEELAVARGLWPA
jgi:glycosyltransferase involved in cell wall biosynthesis